MNIMEAYATMSPEEYKREFQKQAPRRRVATNDAVMRLRKASALASIEQYGYWTDVEGNKRTDTFGL